MKKEIREIHIKEMTVEVKKERILMVVMKTLIFESPNLCWVYMTKS